MTKLLLVLAFDEANAMPLATTLRSLVETNLRSWPIECFLLEGGISAETREKIIKSLPEQSVTIQWVTVDARQFSGVASRAAAAHLSGMAYARLLIPNVLPQSVQRVLYLDADILVMDDLMPLWEIDLQGAILGAVADSSLQEAIERGLLSAGQVPAVQDYFNSGVLLIDLALWREKQVSEKALEYLSCHPQALYPDQDALNAVCDNAWRKLDSRWNFQGHLRTRIAKIAPDRRPAIVHFVTGVKPWNAKVPSVNASFYDSYRSRTRFARTPWDRFSDSVTRSWTNTKASLKKYRFIRSLTRRVKAGGQELSGSSRIERGLGSLPDDIPTSGS